MKKTLKQMIILAVMVLCMLALFTVAASAATYADDNAAIAGNAVARIGAEGTGTYYESIGAAVADVPENGTTPTEITLIANAAWSSEKTLENKAVTFKGANNTVIFSLETGVVLNDNASLAFEDLKISVVQGSGIQLIELRGSGLNIKFDGCEINCTLATNFIRSLGLSCSVDSLIFSDVTFSGTGQYLIAIGAGGEQAYGSAANPVLFENVVGDFAYWVYNKNGLGATIHLKVVGSTVSGAVDPFFGTTVCDDAAAKLFGYGYRVGDEAVGELDTVYFTTKSEALQVAAAGVKVWDITGATPVEVVKTCEHTYTDDVVAPTCTEDGYTKHTCTKCGETFQDTTVPNLGGHNTSEATCIKKAVCSVCKAEIGELARHKYSLATCTKKAKCSVCGAERGELAKHVDKDNNEKCDNCDAKITADETTAAAAAEEKKGCKGTVSAAGLALIAALGSCAIFVEKKRK